MEQPEPRGFPTAQDPRQEHGNRKAARGSFPTYLRFSVTDRCNFRCRYCRVDGAFVVLDHEEILRYEEIRRIVAVAASAGVWKVRLTGGEPLVRKDLPDLVEQIAALESVRDLCLTTNGTLLPRLARKLKDAGLSRVSVSLDSLDRDRFKNITGVDRLHLVLEGIDAALEAGLTPLKINAVVLRGVNDDEIPAFAELARTRKIEVRFIEFMPLGVRSWTEQFFPATEMEARLREALPAPPEVLPGMAPATRRLGLPGGGVIGLITPISAPFCDSCNRLRVTSDGQLRACLLAGGEVDLKGPLRAGATDEELLALFQRAWSLKPAWHGVRSGHPPVHPPECGGMRRIGG